jgi:hypothetical protein
MRPEHRGSAQTWALAAILVVAAACGGPEKRDTATPGTPEAANVPQSKIPQHSTLTGCLRRGAIAGTFVLTEAGPAEVGTGGVSAPTSPSGTYPLVNTGDTDLTNYVGSRVTVSGRFQPETDTAGADRAAGVAERSGAVADVRELIVEEVEKTEGTCAADKR